LVEYGAIPVQAVIIELAKDEVCGARDFTRGVYVFNAQQPLSVIGAGIEKAC